ncbi:TetR/AcrR family transcriptional regulator [Granulicella mallensis]|uniref:AcrR family transcriptional regulator n=1 Tax=Granulicella mallensis TaxID=940614 RepID=A0A7W7ZN00_9BACT|nr:TetR/AcrR family transcriptional regulator [Granulicella mallensis]MBB5062698.1 AcrR family transcriptional regulator [Granulicella mallensis]
MTSTLHSSALTNSSVKDPGVYHHRNLRSALIAAAREALETVAPESISLKALAAQLGVSQPAPYRHFSSREALLAAVATDGFEQFTAALAEAAGEGPESERFERACVAYLRFGGRYPGLYRLMFASHLLKTATDPALERAYRIAFDLLLHQIEKFIALKLINVTAIWVWSTLHGLVMLEAEGLTSATLIQKVTPADVVRHMIATLSGAPRSPKGKEKRTHRKAATRK